MALDLKIDQTTDDIALSQGRVDTVSGADAKAQRIRSRLLTVKGEWFLDTDFGLDYYGVVWVKGTPRSVLTAHVNREILQETDPGDEITKFDIEYDGITRTLSLAVVIEGADGSTTVVNI